MLKSTDLKMFKGNWWETVHEMSESHVADILGVGTAQQIIHCSWTLIVLVFPSSCRAPALRLTLQVKKWVPDVPREYFKLPGPEEKLDFLRRRRHRQTFEKSKKRPKEIEGTHSRGIDRNCTETWQLWALLMVSGTVSYSTTAGLSWRENSGRRPQDKSVMQCHVKSAASSCSMSKLGPPQVAWLCNYCWYLLITCFINFHHVYTRDRKLHTLADCTFACF